MIIIPVKFDASGLIDTLVDIASSGPVGDVANSEWRTNEIEARVGLLSDTQKHTVWKLLQEHIEGSDGWSINDIRYFKQILGASKITLRF